MKPDLSIVIPVYNETEGIPALFEAIDGFVPSVSFTMQFVFVDDGSADASFAELAKRDIPGAQMKLVRLSRNFGSHAAIRAGILAADADHVMVYSADMPEPIEDIKLFYDTLMQGYELVYSERIGYRGSLGSRIFSKMVTKYIERTYPTGGLIGIAFGKKMKEQLNANIENNSSIFFQVFQLGFSKKSIPVEYVERGHGQSKWTFRKKMKLLIDSFVMFSYTPIRFISILGALLALVGLIWALVIIVVKLVSPGSLAAGWPTTLSILLIGFGITNISLGVIAEYLVRTLDASRRRPTFVIDEVVTSEGARADVAESESCDTRADATGEGAGHESR